MLFSENLCELKYTKPSPVTQLLRPQLTSTFKLRLNLSLAIKNFEELFMRLVLPFQYLSPEMRQQVFFVFLHRGSVHLFVSNGPSSGVPWDAGVPRWKPLVLLFQNYWFISQIRQRKYFNLSWFICESEARLSGLERRLNKFQKSIQRWKCQGAGNKTCNDCL